MTVVIVVCLRDSVFLMTDGRLSNHVTHEVISDNVEKMKVISSNFICAHMGVDIPVQGTLDRLNKEFIEKAQTTKEIKNHVSTAMFYGLGPFLFAVPSMNLNREAIERLRFGVIYGGILSVNSEPFIGGKIWTANGPGNELIETMPGKGLIVGGNDVETRQYFGEKMCEHVDNPADASVSNCVSAGIYAIRKTQQTHASVGGVIRYYVLNKNLEITYVKLE